MNRTLPVSAVLTVLLLGACATSRPPPPSLLEARASLRSAELDATVLTYAPLELNKATESLKRADQLQVEGEPVAEITSAAHVASQQAKTATAIAKAKSNDVAIAGAEVDRERARADMLAARAKRAQADTAAAQAQSTAARAQAASAQAQSTAAREQAASARAQGVASREQAADAEQRAKTAEAAASAAREQAGQLQHQLAALEATQTTRGMLVTLGDVLFEFNRAEVKSGAQASLRKLADFLRENPSRHILIEGHTDSIGSASANTALSLRRADAVDAALVGMGLAAQRATTVGYGEEFPVADNSTDTNRALNRRVEVYIAENDQPVRQRR